MEYQLEQDKKTLKVDDSEEDIIIPKSKAE